MTNAETLSDSLISSASFAVVPPRPSARADPVVVQAVPKRLPPLRETVEQDFDALFDEVCGQDFDPDRVEVEFDQVFGTERASGDVDREFDELFGSKSPNGLNER
jgi:hypothetical protein